MSFDQSLVNFWSLQFIIQHRKSMWELINWNLKSAVAALCVPEARTVRSASSFLTTFINISRDTPAFLNIVQLLGEETVIRILMCIGMFYFFFKNFLSMGLHSFVDEVTWEMPVGSFLCFSNSVLISSIRIAEWCHHIKVSEINFILESLEI